MNPLKALLFFSALLSVLCVSAVKPSSAQTECPTGVTYSTLVGDSLQEDGADIALSGNNAWIAGTTYSFNFPSPDRTNQHGVDVIMLGLDETGSALNSTVWVNPDGENDVDEGRSIDIDAAGNIYLSGTTRSGDFCAAIAPDLPGYDTTFAGNGNDDGFIVKYAPDNTPLYCTYIGGSDTDRLLDIAVSDTGEVYITGGTWSNTDFPGTVPADHAGLRDIFVMKLDATGENLVYSTLIGGAGQEEALALDLAANGEVALTGWTFSADFPATPNADDTTANGGADAFAVKLNASGAVTWASYLGGASEDRGYAVGLDNGLVYVTGGTESADFPTTTGAYDESYNGVGFGAHDIFLTIFTPPGTSQAYSTFIGSSAEERAYGLQIGNNSVWLTGFTNSDTFPTTLNAIDTTHNGGDDVFLLNLDLPLNDLTYSTYLGGRNDDTANALQIDPAGNIYLVGDTRSADFCTTSGAYDETANGDRDLFVTKITLPGIPTAIQLTNAQIAPSSLLIFILITTLITLTLISHHKSPKPNKPI